MTETTSSLSDLVKDMVKEMDANEFYARGDMYDESLEEPWFNIEIRLEKTQEAAAVPPASLRKPWSEFQRLHYLLLTDEFGCDDDVKSQFPSLPSSEGPQKQGGGGGRGVGGGGFDDGVSRSVSASASRSGTAVELDAYMNALLAIPAVVRSQVFSGFLDDHRRATGSDDGADGDTTPSLRSSSSAGAGKAGGPGESNGDATYTPETAIDFLVQPFDYTSVYVPRGTVHTARIDVLRGESVVWKFEVLDHLDIRFSVVFRPQPIGTLFRSVDDEGDPDIGVEAVSWGYAAAGEGGEVVLDPGGVGAPRAAADAPGNASASTGSDRRSGGGGGWWGGGGSTRSVPEDRADKAGGVDAPERAEAIAKEGQESQDSTVHLPTRYSTGGGDPVQGSFTCPADGTCILRWDNSYSRLRGKRLRFVMESVTVQTMRAAIEAAGAAEHKRRASRSAAAQSILDSGPGQVKLTVRAVTALDGASNAGDSGADEAAASSGGNSAGASLYGSSGSSYNFIRIRRVAGALLRELGTMVDAQGVEAEAGNAILWSGASHADGSSNSNSASSPYVGFGGRRRGRGNVDLAAVEKLVERFEKLEDEVASSSARRAQSEAQAKVLLATLQKANTKAERLDRGLEEAREELAAVRQQLEEAEGARDEAVAAEARSSTRLQSSEEELLRTKRERELLQAERSVWQVARSGIQEELAKVVAELEQQRHRHEDANRALVKSRESRAHAEAEVARLTRRLEEERGGVGGIRAALAAEREASRLAREEAEDARAAVAELDATVAELGAQKRVLVAGLRARERALGDRCAAAEARAEESAMMRRAAETRMKELEEDAERREAVQADNEVRLQRLRAEKRVLLAEIRKGSAGGSPEMASAGVGAGEGGREASGEGKGLGRVAGSGDGPGVGAGPGRPGEKVRSRRGKKLASDLADGGAGVGATIAAGAAAAGTSGMKEAMAMPDEAEGGRVTPVVPPASDTQQDNKATLKQLSRQLVHLRERQHHLREDLANDPSNSSAQRLQRDVDRAVQNLEVRVRKLLAVVSKGGKPLASPSPSAGSEREDGGSPPREGGVEGPVPPSPPAEDVESFAV